MVSLCRIAVCAIFYASGSPQLSPKTVAYDGWRVGLLPDTMPTFTAALASMGLGVGFTISAFRFFLFRDGDSRMLDFINTLLQVNPNRACNNLVNVIVVLISVPRSTLL